MVPIKCEVRITRAFTLDWDLYVQARTKLEAHLAGTSHRQELYAVPSINYYVKLLKKCKLHHSLSLYMPK